MVQWLVALLPSLKDLLKTIGKWVWGYAQSALQSMWDNKWIILIASTCGGLFLGIMNMLNGWFAFPGLLNVGIQGIFHLNNMVWVASNWKSSPINKGGSEEPKVSVS